MAAAGSLALMALCGWALGSPWWEPALLLAGAGLLAVECLIPGFGPAGILGVIASLAGFYLTAGGQYFLLRLLAALLPLALCPLLRRRYGRPEAFPDRFVHKTVNDAAAGYVAHTARPELEKLSAPVKETINLSVMLDREIFYLDKGETFRSVVCNTKVGTRAPAHATSGGKIMLAFHDPDYVDAYCRDLPQMQRLTDRTVFSPDLLREQLAQARINGFAIDDGEIEPGLICVGAPIFGLDQTVVAAVSIAGPTFRMKEELDVMTRAVKATAANISRLMGGRP